MVSDLQHHLPAPRSDPNLDRRARRRVYDGIAHQVADDLPQLMRITDHERAAVAVNRNRSRGIHRACVVGRVARKMREVYGLAHHVVDLVEPRERQEVLHDHAHPGGLALDAAHRPFDVSGLARSADPEQLRISADRRKRCAKLVRGIGQEATQPVLAFLPLRKGLLQPLQHRVQRDPQPADLRARRGWADSARQVPGRDRARRLPDAVQRAQPEPHDHPAQQREREQHPTDHQGLDPQQPVECAVHLRHRHGHDRGARLVRGRLGDRPVLEVAAALGADGDDLPRTEVGGDVGRRGGHLPI